jgi:serine/threonine protein kinase/CHASE2 domain-containing sensor protein
LSGQIEHPDSSKPKPGPEDPTSDDFMHHAHRRPAAFTDLNRTFSGEQDSALPAFDGFTIRRVLGAGGMGTVYEAEQHRPHRRVALKVLRPELETPTSRKRFETEIQALAALEHQNIARIYEAGMHRSNGHILPYYAMELVPGARAIDDYAHQNELSIRKRVQLVLHVCDAVHTGHRAGIIHRDLKPQNILVDAQGQPKVIDFGVARIVNQELNFNAADTMPGQIVGTIRYMSPEQVAGQRSAIDERSDVYALGVILYELLTGKLPYDIAGRTLPEIAKIIGETQPKRPSAYRNTISGDLETVLLKALEKQRDRRYQSADDLRRDLERCLSGEAIEARRPTMTYLLTHRSRRVVSRSPIVSFIIAVTFAGLFAELVGVPLMYTWTPLDRMYRSTLLNGVMPAHGAKIDGFEHVRIIGIDDDSMNSLAELAAADDITDVEPGSFRSARALSGKLMEKLAKARPAVVAWDMTFVLPSDERDAEFLKGVDALGTIPVLIVNPWWQQEVAEHEMVNPNFRIPRIGRATASIVLEDEGGWLHQLFPRLFHRRDGLAHVILAMDRGGPRAIPGFAAKVVAAYRFPSPDSRFEMKLDSREARAQFHFTFREQRQQADSSNGNGDSAKSGPTSQGSSESSGEWKNAMDELQYSASWIPPKRTDAIPPANPCVPCHEAEDAVANIAARNESGEEIDTDSGSHVIDGIDLQADLLPDDEDEDDRVDTDPNHAADDEIDPRAESHDDVIDWSSYTLRGDVGAIYSIEIPPQAVLDANTYSYAHLLRTLRATEADTGDDSEEVNKLKDELHGKVVLIGQTYRTSGDQHDLGGGRCVHGVYIQATAIEAILRAKIVKLNKKATERWFIALGCLFGLVSGAGMVNARRRSTVLFTLAVAGFIGYGIWLAASQGEVFSPLVPALALLVAAAACFTIQKLRQGAAY